MNQKQSTNKLEWRCLMGRTRYRYLKPLPLSLATRYRTDKEKSWLLSGDVTSVVIRIFNSVGCLSVVSNGPFSLEAFVVAAYSLHKAFFYLNYRIESAHLRTWVCIRRTHHISGWVWNKIIGSLVHVLFFKRETENSYWNWMAADFIFLLLLPGQPNCRLNKNECVCD